MVDYNFILEKGVTKAKLYKFFYSRNYFLHIPKLLHELSNNNRHMVITGRGSFESNQVNIG